MRGTDHTGRTWHAVQLTGRALRAAYLGAQVAAPAYRLDRNGRPYVTACGTATIATLTARYAITWES
jgi:hypothetical protein